MLKVYVNPLSGPSNKVLFGLHAMDDDYARVTAMHVYTKTYAHYGAGILDPG